MLWPPDVESWLIWKDPDAGKDWGQEEKGTTEDEVVGWHHRLNGHGFGWTLGVGHGQGGLACCSSWGCRESDTTERLNWTEPLSITKNYFLFLVKSHVMWDLSSLTRDWTCTPALVMQHLTAGLPGNSHQELLLPLLWVSFKQNLIYAFASGFFYHYAFEIHMCCWMYN